MKQFFVSIACICIFISNNINGYSFQEKSTNVYNQDYILDALHLELKNPHYRKEVLPNDFSYLLNLIECGVTTNQPPTYLRSVIKLFSNLLKGADYVNAYAFSELLDTFPTLLTPYFSLNISCRYLKNKTLLDAHMYDRLYATINDMLYIKFSTDYESFKKDPTQFLSTISNDIVDIAQEEVTREQLRQSLVRFCETVLNKLVWNAEEQEKTWEITKKISDQLATLLEYNIFDDANDLDDLYWTLLCRYCYVILDITATDMKPEFYEIIKHDLTTQAITLFELEEQDAIVEPKKRYFTRTLMQAQTRAQEYEQELIIS